MEHYFIAKEHSESDYFWFKENMFDLTFDFKSCDDIFSKDKVDYGSKVLIQTVAKNFNLKGKVLDIGCGYGVIGIVLARLNSDAQVYMCDINTTAVELSKINAQKNKIQNIEDIFYSNAYEFVSGKFDYIISNPPIKAGKANLLNILTNAYSYLNENGKLIFVIKKKHGEDSVKKHLSNIFKQVEILKRDSGYYIICCTR